MGFMASSTKTQEKRLAELKKEVTKRGFDRHPSILKTISELPCELQSPSIAALGQSEPIQTVISFPPQIQRGWHYVPKQALLFTPTNIIHVLASIWPDQEPQVTCIPACSVLYVNVSLILLYGYLEIVARGQDVPMNLGMEFNTVAWDYCLSAPLRGFLQATRALTSLPIDKPAYSSTAREAVDQLPIKFFNGVRLYGLLPNEELQEILFQPRMWKRWLHFFQSPLSPNILLMLTSNYVVVIQEELNVEQGWLLTYVPRSTILEIQNQQERPWNTLSFQLKQGDQCAQYELKRLKRETVDSWHQQWSQHGGRWLDEMIPNN
jgi:hypothetical protein